MSELVECGLADHKDIAATRLRIVCRDDDMLGTHIQDQVWQIAGRAGAEKYYARLHARGIAVGCIPSYMVGKPLRRLRKENGALEIQEPRRRTSAVATQGRVAGKLWRAQEQAMSTRSG